MLPYYELLKILLGSVLSFIIEFYRLASGRFTGKKE